MTRRFSINQKRKKMNKRKSLTVMFLTVLFVGTSISMSCSASWADDDMRKPIFNLKGFDEENLKEIAGKLTIMH